MWHNPNKKEAYYEETVETAGCPFVGSGHGSGNAAVFSERHFAKYPVGDCSECGGCGCREYGRSDVDKNRR